MLLVASLLIATWIGIFGSLESRYSYAWVFFGITAGLVMTEALAAPDNVLHFAATRTAEIAVGTLIHFDCLPIFREEGGRADRRANHCKRGA